jgi:ribosome biogenesis GTPase A
MSIYNYQAQKQDVLKLFNAAIALATQQNTPAIAQNLRDAAEYLVSGKLNMVVCGEFKQGKSSLINALLNENNLFPVDVDITTSIVSTITYGEAEKVTIFLGELGNAKPKTIQRSEIPDYVTERGNKGNTKQARLLVIESPNPQLKEGLVIADTPGVGSLNTEHTAVSYAFIPNADVVLFVTDALAPLTTDELDFIRRIQENCNHFVFVVTKIDKKSDYPSIIESDRQKLAQVLNRAPEKILIIPVSSELKKVYLQYQESEDLEESNFPQLEAELWKFLGQQRGSILILQALNKLGRHLSDLKRPLQAEWNAYQQQDEPQLKELEARYKVGQERSKALLELNATWRTQLSDGVNDIRTEMNDVLQEGFERVRTQSNRYLDDPRLLAEPAQIVSLLEVDIDALMSSLSQHLSQQAATLHSKLERATGLDINPYEVDELGGVGSSLSAATADIKQVGWWDKTLQVARNASFSLSTAGTIGGLLGGTLGLVLGGVGAPIGYGLGAMIGSGLAGIAGLITGTKEGMTQVKERSRHAVAQVLIPFINKSQSQSSKSLLKAVTELERTMRDELSDQLRREQDTNNRSLEAILESRKLSQAQIAQKKEALQRPLQQLNQVLSQAEQLAKAAIAQQEGGA